MSGNRIAWPGWQGVSVALATAALTLTLAGAAPGEPGPKAAAQPAAGGIISTFAGGVGGPAPARRVGIARPCGLGFGAGELYIGQAGGRTGTGLVRAVNATTGGLTTPAGTAAGGLPGDGGPAVDATVSACGTTVDQAGNLVLADPRAAEVRVVAASSGTFYGQPMTAGDIYPVAGGGSGPFTGSGVPATSTKMCYPVDVQADQSGNLVIADSGHPVTPCRRVSSLVRVVATSSGAFYGQPMIAGDVYTVAGDGKRGYSGDGGPATQASLGADIGQVRLDATGNLVITDVDNNVVRVVAASSGTFYGQPMTAGDIYTVAGDGLGAFGGDGGPALSAELSRPQGVAVDGDGNLVIADSDNHRVRVVAGSTGTFYGQPMTAGDIYTVTGGGTGGMGDGRPEGNAQLSTPVALEFDDAGNLLVADLFHNRVRVLAASSGTFYGQPMTAGDIYTAAGNGTLRLSDTNLLATRAELNEPGNVSVRNVVSSLQAECLAVDDAGNLLVADTENNRVAVVAAARGTFYGRPMTARHMYTVAGQGSPGFAGDGSRATRALLWQPAGLAADQDGNLVFTDSANARVRVVAGSTGSFYGQPMTVGDVYTVAGDGTRGLSGDGGPATAAELDFPGGMSVDGSGNLVIADELNGRIRVVAAGSGTFYGQPMTAGDIYTVAGGGTGGLGDGGPAAQAQLEPAAVTFDGAGNMVISDSGDSRVRVVAAGSGTFYGQPMTAGDIYTVAGDGSFGYSGDGGPAVTAELNQPVGVAVDAAGNLLIADTPNARVRVVAAGSGTFYGQPMTAGDIYTVAGTGTPGFSGDGGPATSAELTFPVAVVANPAGDLLLADSLDGRVRMVTG
jgi:hypothetical protein